MRIVRVAGLLAVLATGIGIGWYAPRLAERFQGYHPETSAPFIDRVSVLQQLPRDGSYSIVMLGDSLTQRGPWNEIASVGNVANRGLEGATVDQITDLIVPTIPRSAKRIYVMAGVNDLFASRKPCLLYTSPSPRD